MYMVACFGVFAATLYGARVVPALAAGCPNEPFRTGRSASLPDCRAYELVTPEELGRSQAIAFEQGADYVGVSADGEHVVLSSLAPLEPSPSQLGTRAVFSRSSKGWGMLSAVPPGAGELGYKIRAIDSSASLLGIEATEPYSLSDALEVGPVGGPYTRIVDESNENQGLLLAGANAGTADVPTFHTVLFDSSNHKLRVSSEREQELAEQVPAGVRELYEWSEGRLRLVNVEGEGADMRLLPSSECGVELGTTNGAGNGPEGGAIGAISADDSKVFFTSCSESEQPSRLWMRVDGREIVEVSAPAGVRVEPSERSPVYFNEATADGSEVFFETATPLTADETPAEKAQAKLFMYNTNTRTLTLVALGVEEHGGVTTASEPLGMLVSEDGSTVYYEGEGEEGQGIYRYEIGTGEHSFVAKSLGPGDDAEEPAYTTPDGRFLVFVSRGIEVDGPRGLELESRGGATRAGLYRYDALNGSVVCVSCGSGIAAPERGEMWAPHYELPVTQGAFHLVQISADGNRVFFQTTSQLVPEDTNSTETEEATVGGSPGEDVYEWEAFGVEEGPVVFCRVVVGCTHLISAGEDVGAEHFLGASEDGRDLFFSSAAQLLPQATPEFSNIYDARVGGGFPRKQAPVECTACQGVGAPPPLFGAPASSTFVGAGNPSLPGGAPAPVAKPKPKAKAKVRPRCRRGYRRNRRGRCVRVARKGRVVR
ncbi:MAG TPA: hypothetical protein VNY31_05210 [Solirubrobacteraceae bacterium]|nr:hypothetical protein [Solirubrobacteraceae bacterium]